MNFFFLIIWIYASELIVEFHVNQTMLGLLDLKELIRITKTDTTKLT